MSAKLSIGDIMATEMHASDAYTIIQLWMHAEIDRNGIEYALGLLNIIILMHIKDMKNAFSHDFGVINDALR